jgi:hypothetical protein
MNYTADDVQNWRDEEAAKRYSREWLIWLCDQALKAMTPQPEATATRDRRISVGWALLEALRRREAGEATREDQSYAYLHDAWHDASPKPQNGRS